MSSLHRGLVIALVALTQLFAMQGAHALIETYDFSSPELQARYKLLSAELRCPKCQNQNIADSDAPIAQDLRHLLHQKLEDGATDDQILDYMVERYGEFVRYRPSFEGTTRILWVAPAVLLLLGAGLVVLTLRSRTAATPPGEALSTEEQARVRALLDEEEHSA